MKINNDMSVLYTFGAMVSLIMIVSCPGYACDWDWPAGVPALYGYSDIWGFSTGETYLAGSVNVVFSYNGVDWDLISGAPPPMWVMYGYNSVWGLTPTDVYLVGVSGYKMMINSYVDRYNGTMKESIPGSFSNVALLDIWGSSPGDLYAVGSGTLRFDGQIFHYNGTTWNKVSSGIFDRLRAVWGTSSNNVYAVGDSEIINYNGIRWAKVHSGRYTSVWGTDANNVYAAGSAGTIAHYDGAVWTNLSVPPGENLNEVWGFSATEIYVVGNNGLIKKFDGSIWSSHSSPGTEHLRKIWGRSSSDLFVLGDVTYHYDGATWSVFTTPFPKRMYDVWASDPDNVYTVGEDGWILHYDGASWSLNATVAFIDIKSIWGSSATDVYVTGAPEQYYDGSTWKNYDNVYHYDGSVWSPFGVLNDTGSDNCVWGLSSDDVYVGSTQGVYHYDGFTWSLISSSDLEIFGFWASGKNDVYGGSLTGIEHYDGVSWTTVFTTALPVNALRGSSPSDIYAVAGGPYSTPGMVIHYDGTTWNVVHSTPEALLDIWWYSSSNIHVVGAAGKHYVFDGSTWTEYQTRTVTGLTGIWGVSSTELYSVSPDVPFGVILKSVCSPSTVPVSGTHALFFLIILIGILFVYSANRGILF